MFQGPLRGSQHPLGCLSGCSQNKGHLCLLCPNYTDHLHMTFPLIPLGHISQASMSPKGQVGTTPTHLNLRLCVQSLGLPDYVIPKPTVISFLFPMVAPSLLPVAAPSRRRVLYTGRPWAGINLFSWMVAHCFLMQTVLSFTGPIRKAKPTLNPSEADSHTDCPLHLGLRGQLPCLRRALTGRDPRERRIMLPFLSAPFPSLPHTPL